MRFELPWPVTGMLLVFMVLLVLGRLSRPVTDRAVWLFRVPVRFLGRWMALFFVPALVRLMDVPYPGTGILARIVVVLVAGYAFTVLTTAALARRWSRPVTDTVRPPNGAAVGHPPLFHPAFGIWVAMMFVSGILMAMRPSDPRSFSLFLISVTVTGFLVGEVLQTVFFTRLKKMPDAARRLLAGMLHPVLTGAAFVVTVLASAGWDSDVYMGNTWWGAGTLILALLGPAIVSLGFLLYERRAIVFGQWRGIVVPIGLAAPLSLFVTALMASLSGLPGTFALSLVTRSVTTPIAIGIAGVLGSDAGFAAAFSTITGVVGAVWGTPLLARVFKPSDAESVHTMATGVAVGTASHGVGTAALLRTDAAAAAISGVSFALMGAFSAAIAGFAPVQDLLRLIIP